MVQTVQAAEPVLRPVEGLRSSRSNRQSTEPELPPLSDSPPRRGRGEMPGRRLLPFTDHPSTRKKIVPAALFTAPENPEKAQNKRSKCQHSDPTQKRASITNRALFRSDNTQTKQPFPDRFPIAPM